jgi:O-antigen ligase
MSAAFEQGSGLDSIIFLGLIFLGLRIVSRRRLKWSDVLRSNWVLALFMAFGLVSVIWSDFPYVTFKRWVRDLGTYLMVLVAVSDLEPMTVVAAIIRRLSAILTLLSVVLIKYYPQIGVQYNPWSGTPEYVGATTTKNMLGMVCLVSGLFYFWDTLVRWPERKSRLQKRALFLNVIFLAITLWLLMLTNSATSIACLILGCLVLLGLRSKQGRSNPGLVAFGIPAALVALVVVNELFDVWGFVAESLGRDSNMHGRTGIWDAVFSVDVNPLLGAGYQSFWMGDRLATVNRILNTNTFTSLSSAHNGYLETYMNLGLIGLCLIVTFMIVSYRRICRQLTVSVELTSLALALFLVTVFYNFSEDAIGESIIWVILLLCVVKGSKTDPLRVEAEIVSRNGTAAGLHHAIERSAN